MKASARLKRDMAARGWFCIFAFKRNKVCSLQPAFGQVAIVCHSLSAVSPAPRLLCTEPLAGCLMLRDLAEQAGRRLHRGFWIFWDLQARV